MHGRDARIERRREAARVKLQASAGPLLDAGEAIRLWAVGMTAPIATNQIEGLVGLFRMVAGQQRPAGVLMTDRALRVARTGWAGSRVIDLLATYPLEPNPPNVAFEQTSSIRGSITVNDTTVYLPGGQLEMAEEIVRAVRSASELAASRGSVGVVRKQFEAFGAAGVDAAAGFWNPDIEWRAVPGAADDVGVMRGAAAVRRYYQEWFDSVEEPRAEVGETLLVTDDAAAVVVSKLGRRPGSHAPLVRRYFVTCRVSDGLIVSGREFSTRDEAIQAVGQAGTAR